MAAKQNIDWILGFAWFIGWLNIMIDCPYHGGIDSFLMVLILLIFLSYIALALFINFSWIPSGKKRSHAKENGTRN